MNVLLIMRGAAERRAITCLIGAEFPAWSCVAVAGIEQGEGYLRMGRCDIALVGLQALGTSPPEWIQAAKSTHPAVKFIVLGATERQDLAVSLIKAGASGYIDEIDSLDRVLPGVLASTCAGAIHLIHASMYAGAAAVSGRNVPTISAFERLSPRQQDVMCHLSKGRSVKEIARQLDLSIGTVKTHMAKAYAALGARNRIQAINSAGLH